MSALMHALSAGFPTRLLQGMAVNFEISVIALAIGLALGLALAFARLEGGALGAASASVVGVMRAAPTFVVMFFLLNAIPRDATMFGIPLALSGVMAVALSLVPYTAAYVVDNGLQAMKQLREGSALGALLFLPNLTRAFFVLVMSSGAGAAIGTGICGAVFTATGLPEETHPAVISRALRAGTRETVILLGITTLVMHRLR